MPQEKTRINPETGQPYPTQKEKLDEITAGIEQGIKDVFNSENYKNYLSVMSRFHNYSFNNCMLIYMQNPNATKVASFKKWSEEFDRHVSKGEKGIKIIAPAPYKKEVDAVVKDKDGNNIIGTDGNPVTEKKIVTMPAFKAVTVFDVSQTRGKPLPELVHSLNGKVENFEYLREAIEKSAPVPMKFEELRDGLDGFYSPKEQSITINNKLSEPQTLCAMIHETAHSLLHDPEKMTEEKSRRREEIEAESVAYAVCKYLGIDTDENSFGYLASWSSDKEVKELKESLETINNTSSLLISSIENKYREIVEERDMTADERIISDVDSYLRTCGAYDYDAAEKQSGSVRDSIKGYMESSNLQPLFEVLELTVGEPGPSGAISDTIKNPDRANAVENLELELHGYDRNFNTEKTYLIDDKAYLHIQRLDDGINYDFSIFSKETMKLIDGGFSDFVVGDKLADAYLYEVAYAVAEDFGFEPKELTVVNEETVEAIEKANEINPTQINEQLKAHEQETPAVKPPCPELTQETLNSFGYTDQDMYPLTKEMALELQDSYCEVFMLHSDNVEAAAYSTAEIEQHTGMFGIEKPTWEQIEPKYALDHRRAEMEQNFLNSKADGYAIYQLKDIAANSDIKFESFIYMEKQGIPIEKERYAFIYSDDFCLMNKELTERALRISKGNENSVDCNFTNNEKLDWIYDKYNLNRPEDFQSRSISVSDILVLRQNGELTCHYVDSIGFKNVPAFLQPERENYLKNAELSVEDDAGMIDGIINNGKKKADNPEIKKEPVSEKKKSVTEKLEEAKAKVASAPNPSKPKERTHES